jgi:ADP-ribose pyrophosphatase YjhB (NUDIX family)
VAGMLHLLPAPLHRLALKLAHALRTRWWRLNRSLVIGCRALVLDDGGRILLIRHSYGPSLWMAPGGSLTRGEEPVTGCLRELREETGCTLDQPRLLTMVTENLYGAVNEVYVVAGRRKGDVKPDGREIVEARFFPLDSLPRDLSPNLTRGLARWLAMYADYSSES